MTKMEKEDYNSEQDTDEELYYSSLAEKDKIAKEMKEQ